MLFLTYWELNEEMPVEEQLKISQKLMSLGLVPFEGFNIIRWDMTPDGWGILLAEAESAADVDKAIYMWRAAGAGFFKTTKTAPAQPVQEVIAQHTELLKTLSSG
jgi:uncharacterized protein YfaA (DUF2138 family)